ncbi:MAG: trypsin-like peptidase domain-containing protein, partial [Pirellulaceae bacterium]|nr:trypsin-like peptidase domain-containing protein [Pirellulaceae bacterium]
MIDDAIFAATCVVSCGNICGTGFLVRLDRVLTARHSVIKALESNAPIELTFSRLPLDDEERRVAATIVAESADLDACILAVEPIPAHAPLPITDMPPREGLSWKTFGFPVSKGLLGHRLYGDIAQVLPKPKAKVDIDLSVDPTVALDSYNGLSGAPVVVHERCVGMLRLRADRSVAAISVRALSALLARHDIPIGNPDDQAPQRPHLAERSEFQQQFEAALVSGGGRYLFLEGAHGIGKTTFCQNFAPADPRLRHLGTYCVLEPTGDSNTLVRSLAEVLHDWLVTTISAHLSGKAARHERKIYPEMAQDVSSLLHALDRDCAKRQCIGVLAIDGLNEVQAADPKLLPYFVGLLPPTLPGHVAIVLSSPSYAGVASVLSTRVSVDNVRALPLLSESASIAYCSKTLTGARASDYEFIRQLCEKANGHPLYLNYLIRHASVPGNARLDDFPVLDGPIERYYERVWQTLSTDEHAVHLLSIMARLREDIPFDMFVNVLNAAEQAVFVPTITRIQHLLLQPDHTAIYHPSFRDYIVGNTRQLDQVIHDRLATFCVAHRTGYCIRNKVFHALRGSTENRETAPGLCTQEWVDDCVVHSNAPDVLLSDVEAVVEAVFRAGQPVDAIRLLLLRQRVSFRYDTLFAVSAGLVAEALVALGRPREALTHVMRHGVLIVNNADAMRIAYAFIKHDYFHEAIDVLDMIARRCISFYSVGEFPAQQFVDVTIAHIEAVLLSRLADGESHIRDVILIQEHARRAIDENISNASFRQQLLESIYALPNGYFLAFCDTYVTTADLARRVNIPKKDRLQGIVSLVLHHMQMVDEHGLAKQRARIDALLTDVEALVRSGVKVRDSFVPFFVDALIRLGAPVRLVEAVAAGRPVNQPEDVTLRGPNGVDAEIHAVLQNGFTWRAKGFLGGEPEYPSISGCERDTWLSSLERAFAFVFYCDGRARRARAHGDGELLSQVSEVFRRDFYAAVRFTLAERVTWERSYALPEASVPFLYECAAELIIDCFPDLLEPLIEFMHDRSQNQLGLYTEGFRECICRVVGYISRHELQAGVKARLVSLLNALRDHVITGVENRRELVPELLRLVTLYAGVGASEAAEGVYREVLRFSMGPSWYKENQFSLMITALGELSSDDRFCKRLPSIAGNLERASGEMTFQRFVRHHKSILIGVLSAQGLVRAACGYFRAESCGNTERLFSEWEGGKVDMPHPRLGNRFPGGAIDEQAAILEIVQHARTVDWRLRWALLEVFQFGDRRHVQQYAREYASLFGEAADQLSVRKILVRRVHAVLTEEMEPDERAGFITTLYEALRPEHRPQFDSLLSVYGFRGPNEGHPRPEEARVVSEKPDSEKAPEPDLYAPGLFGKQASITNAEGQLEDARAQFQLGNTDAAKQLLVSTLLTVQAGGWCVWERPATCSIMAERLLKEAASDASDLTARSSKPLARRPVPRGGRSIA